MAKYELGDVVELLAPPTVGSGPPDNKAVVVGLLVIHPDANEVWMVWPEKGDEMLLTTDPGMLTGDVVQATLAGARDKFYRCMGAGLTFFNDIFKKVIDSGA